MYKPLLIIAVACTALPSYSSAQQSELKTVVKSAFQDNHAGYSSDEVILDDELFDAFMASCQTALPDAEPKSLGWTLMNLRKAGKLSDIEVTQRRSTDIGPILHVAEIVCRSMTDKHQISIDRMLVDPDLRAEFNQRATDVDENIDLYAVRKAAFRLRKTRRLRPELITRIADWGREIKSFSAQEISDDFEKVANGPGIYIFRDATGYLYIGESNNLRRRLEQHLDESSSQSLANYLNGHDIDEITIELHVFDPNSRIRETAVRRAYESELIQSRNPKFNLNAK
jgi:predicted GIY-YIG superfamily endonuclease